MFGIKRKSAEQLVQDAKNRAGEMQRRLECSGFEIEASGMGSSHDVSRTLIELVIAQRIECTGFQYLMAKKPGLGYRIFFCPECGGGY